MIISYLFEFQLFPVCSVSVWQTRRGPCYDIDISKCFIVKSPVSQTKAPLSDGITSTTIILLYVSVVTLAYSANYLVKKMGFICCLKSVS